jgi:hypothetical protein
MQTPGFFSIGICVFIHALATAMAGYFPMDRNYMAQPNSFAHRAHTAAGFIMFLSLFVAQLLGLWVQHWGWVFQGFSLSSAILSLFFYARIFNALKNQSNPGTFQRLGYGAQILWLACLSWLLFID